MCVQIGDRGSQRATELAGQALALTQRAAAALSAAWRRCDPDAVLSFRDAFDVFAENFFLSYASAGRRAAQM